VRRFLIGMSIFSFLLLLVPFAFPNYGVYITTEIFIMAIFALSLGYIMGYAGLVSLGHAAFFGIGAYTIAILGEHISNSYLLILLAVLISGIIALLTGAIFIRTSAFYFLMITLAFGQLLFAILWQFESFTGGADGMSVMATLNLGAGAIGETNAYYYVMAIAFILSVIFLYFFISSPIGSAIRGVKENESRMKALGHNIRFYKLIAYTLSGMMAGFAGSLYAFFNSYVSPDLVNWVFSGEVMLMVIIGGVGTLLGPALGSAIYIVIQHYVSSYTDYWQMIMGAIFVIVVLLGRGGVIHLLMDLRKKIMVPMPKKQLPKVEEEIT